MSRLFFFILQLALWGAVVFTASGFAFQTAFWKKRAPACTSTSGSQSYTTGGTYSFTVPCFVSLTVTVSGAGGGGGGFEGGYNGYPISAQALAGEDSSFNGTVIGRGGTRGHGANMFTVGAGFGGDDGTASGGDTNVTGGGAAGGYGMWVSGQSDGYGGNSKTSTRENQTREVPPVMNPDQRTLAVTTRNNSTNGGNGGLATKTYGAGQLTPGSTVTVVVGRGGAGENASNFIAYTGYDGEPGTVTISWNSAAVRQSCLDIYNAGESAGDGVYTVNPGGAGNVSVYCNMTDGGWTLIMASTGPQRTSASATTDQTTGCTSKNAYCNLMNRAWSYTTIRQTWTDCTSGKAEISKTAYMNDTGACSNTSDQLNISWGGTGAFTTGMKVWNDCSGTCGGQTRFAAIYGSGTTFATTSTYTVSTTGLSSVAGMCSVVNYFCPTGFDNVWVK